MKKINKLTNDIIREKGTLNKNFKDLKHYDLRATFNFNSSDRFFISNQELIRFIKTKKIRTVNKKIQSKKITISRSKLISSYDKKIHFFAGGLKTLQFDFEGCQLGFIHEKNCKINISVDCMNWVDILIYKNLSQNLVEVLHITLNQKEGEKN